MTRDERTRHTSVVLLTLGTGAIDAIGFLHLGGAFSSVMTGNMVLFGLAAAGRDSVRVAVVGIAIVSYIVGVVIGARVAGSAVAADDVWPARVTAALVMEAVLLAVFCGLWISTVPLRQASLEQAMLAIAALALGIQSSAVQRFGVKGLSSTYLTGTLTVVVAGFATRRPLSEQLPGLVILFALIIGAAAGYLVSSAAPLLSPALVLGPLLVVIVVAVVFPWQKAPRGEAAADLRSTV